MIEGAEPESAGAPHAARAYDARSEHIAVVYAKAFVGAGLAAEQGAGRAAEKGAGEKGAGGQLAERVAELDCLIDEILTRHPRFEELLTSALISQSDKLGMLDRVLGGRLSPPLVDFCKVLSEHGRLDLLRSVHRQVHALYDAQRGLKPVRVSTAAPLDAAGIEKLKPTLRTLSGGEPVIEHVVDPALIGGIVLRIGDTVYDGSVARRLEQLREKMIERTVHEIQSRRDSFRYPDGN